MKLNSPFMLFAVAFILTVVAGSVAPSAPAEAQRKTNDNSIYGDRTIRIARFDCLNFRPTTNGGPRYAEALAAAFVLPNGDPPLPQVGNWECEFIPASGTVCHPVAGAALNLTGPPRRVFLEFEVAGSCASFQFAVNSTFRPPNTRIVRLDRSAPIVWRIRTGSQNPNEAWGNSFQVNFLPLENARPR